MRFKRQIWAAFWLLVFCGSVLAVEPNLIAHWKFDEPNGTIAYDSAGGNDGTVYGAMWTSGQIGGALSFDGMNSYVSAGTPASLDDLPLGDMTVCAWIRDEITSGSTWGTIAGCYAYNHGWAFRTLSNANGERSLYFQAPHSGGDYAKWASFQSINGTIVPNTWQHVAVVWDSSAKTAKLYIDGAEPSYQLTDPGIGAYNSDASRDKEIGRIPHVGGIQHFEGKIDDVRIYDGALSAEEIEALYLEGLSTYERAVINIEDALADKAEVIDIIEAAMAKEQAASDALDELLESGDYGDLAKSDIVGATSKVEQAIQAEEQSLHFLDKSVEDLEGSLEDLGWEPNLVAHWKLDEGEGDTAYDSAGDNDGTVYGAMWTSGQIDGALDFDGSGDYIDCGSGSGLDITDSITVGAWVKRPNFTTDGTIAGKTNGNSVTAGYGLFSYKEGMEFNFYSGGWRRTTPRVPMSAGEWHYVAGTYDGSIAYLYIDGEQRASKAYVGTIAAATGHPFNIGFWRSGYTTYFKGEIDDVRVYNKALSAEEILQLYEDNKGKNKNK